MRKRWLAPLLLLALAPAARAQVVIHGEDGEVIIIEDGPPPSLPAPAPTAAQPAQPPKDDPRLKRLLALQVDRRTDAALGAWAAQGTKAGAVDLAPIQSAGVAELGSADPAAIESQALALQRGVALGLWDDVGRYLGALPADQGPKVWQHLVNQLASPPQPRNPQVQSELREAHALSPDDVLGLAEAAPAPLDDEQARAVGRLLREARRQGWAPDALVAAWRAGTPRLGGDDPARRRAAVEALLEAGLAPLAGPLLPDVDAVAPVDSAALGPALDLLARHALAVDALEPKLEHVERAWRWNARLLEVPDLAEKLLTTAVERAVRLAPRLGEPARVWLAGLLGGRSERGALVLALLGGQAAQARQTMHKDAAGRHALLDLQHLVATALVEKAPDQAAAWSTQLDLLARTWLEEAEFSLAEEAPAAPPNPDEPPWLEQQRLMMQRGDPRKPDPVPCAKLGPLRPGEAWLRRLSAPLLPRTLAAVGRLHTRAKEEDEAFAVIVRLAPLDPAAAHALAEQHLRAWIDTHDPNAGRRQNNPYIYFWGFEERANAIPLTRSAQERNLDALATKLARLRTLPVKPVDEALIIEAFVRSHSSAEVYRLDAIEKVLGPAGTLSARSVARLAQTMRGNLAGVWRDPKTQQAKKTKRLDADLKREVERGYGVARSLVESALTKAPASWELLLARAAIAHDQNDWLHREVERSAEFARQRAAAFEAFAAAAAAYAGVLPTLKREEETTEPFAVWLHAALGACDLDKVSSEHVPDLKQAAAVGDALRALPGEAAARHLETFAKDLFLRMGAVKPEVKHGYLRAGFAAVKDHPAAKEAREVLDYYADLVREVQLRTRLDGTDRVGRAPFGVFIDLRHTQHIEREAGGFGKYLTNQNQQQFAWNYGRPTEDYRDKFEARARKALEERFEVLSITFHQAEVKSRGDPEPGWRVTPYAYALLRARGPEVDRVPPLELSLDFLDTSGFAVLPIASPALPVDCSGKPDPRPVRDLEVVQTLDERRASEGKLSLEVKATAHGLVGPLEELVDLKPPGFEVVKTDDPGPAVVRIDPEAPDGAVQSERIWTLELKGKDAQAKLPSTFRFGTTRPAEAKATFQRYVDEDLVAVPQEAPLDREWGTRRTRWPWYLVAAALVLVAGWFVKRIGAPPPAAAPAYAVPARLTPFTVAALLRRIADERDLSADQRTELEAALQRIEARHFAREAKGEDVDLARLAADWVQRGGARPRRA